MKKRVTKPMVVMRLYWESKELVYDKEDRKRFAKICRVVRHIPTKSFYKLITKDYSFYRGFCYSNNIKETLTDNEFDILLAVVDNIKIGYYKEK